MAETPPAKSSLTAWERWELASFEHSENDPARPSTQSPAAAAANEQLARVREAARLEGFQAGHEAGFASGHAEGLSAGKAAAEALGRREAENFVRLAEALETRIDELNQTVADDLVALSIALASQVVRETLSLRPEVLVSVVREALGQMPLQHASIHLHPEDASLVRSRAGDQLTHAGHRIHEDPKLSRGDVVIESGGTHLDATLATRWRRTIETLGQGISWSDIEKP